MKIYLPNHDIIMDLHDAIIEVSGGRPGVLHDEVIDAAIHRPKTYLAYQDDCSLHTVCAVLLDSIARNHAFVEGNKRTGLMTALLTYELNDVALTMQADQTDDFENLVLWVVEDKPPIEEITSKLEYLVGKYQKGKVSKFVDKIKGLIEPFEG
ncbi:MAG TPA: type II toxin-antitoxin system death-on-curing family toxin [Candidatus Saccharimonadales bacterium]|nr:type II toxin-antitoxin system death-on-curing family toxin [Candidatus Saccharimonadales bacterium]